MAGARIVVNAAGRLKRLRDAPCHGKRAGADSTVIEVSVQIEAQQRLEERPERGPRAQHRQRRGNAEA
jgi:hypothetical protein